MLQIKRGYELNRFFRNKREFSQVFWNTIWNSYILLRPTEEEMEIKISSEIWLAISKIIPCSIDELINEFEKNKHKNSLRIENYPVNYMWIVYLCAQFNEE